MDHKTDTDSARAAFEAWFSDGGRSPKAIERNGASGSYKLAAAATAWTAFQAGRASLAASAGSEPVAAPPMDGEIALIEKAAQRAGITSLLNHGAASCVFTEGCCGVSQEHMLAYTREIALHCAIALGAGPAPSGTPSTNEKPLAWAIFAPNGNIRMWSVKPDEVARAAAGFEQEPVPLYTHPSPPEGMVGGWLNADDAAALQRIDECFTDGQSHDQPAARVKRLCEIGVLRHVGGGVYEITSFGACVLGDQHFTRPLETLDECNERLGREHRARLTPPIAAGGGKDADRGM